MAINSTAIDHTEESLIQLSDIIESWLIKDGEDLRIAIMHGILQCIMSIDKIKEITINILERKLMMERELVRLENFARTFNTQYATDHNHIFTTSEILFYKIRSTLKTFMESVKSFCKRTLACGPIINGREQKLNAYANSWLVNSRYYQEPIGAESLHQSVFDLCHAMQEFRLVFIKALRLCRSVIKHENEIRQNPKLLYKIFTYSCDKEFKILFSRGLLTQKEDCEDVCEISLFDESSSDFNVSLARLFHNLDHKQLSIIVRRKKLKRSSC